MRTHHAATRPGVAPFTCAPRPLSRTCAPLALLPRATSGGGGDHAAHQPGWPARLAATALAVLVSLPAVAPPVGADTLTPPPPPSLSYAAAAATRAGNDPTAYTPDGWAAAQAIAVYAREVEDVLAPAEQGAGCEACEAHRASLERVWQTISREFYSPGPAGGGAPSFSQAAWAARLLPALRSRGGGLLRTQADYEAAAAALVASLGDPYTAYLPPPAFRAALRRPNRAELSYLAVQGVGPGIVLATDGDGAGGVVGGGGGGGASAASAAHSATPTGPAAAAHPAAGVRVVAVAAESAAEEAGVRRGDTLLEADWSRLDRLPPADARALLRGPAGSEVTLKILPGGGGGSVGGGGARGFAPAAGSRPVKPVTVTLERRALPQPPVKVVWGVGVGGGSGLRARGGGSSTPTSTPSSTPAPSTPTLAYIRLHFFARETTDVLAAALMEGEVRGVGGWVVDVRGNPGGVFEDGIASAALFLPSGAPIARTVRTGGGGAEFFAGALPAADYPATAAGQLTAAPVAVVVDSGSASASEVFAGALAGAAPRRRVALVGEGRTFGKGLVQYYFQDPADSGGGHGHGHGSATRRQGGGNGGGGGSGGETRGGLKVTVAKYLSPPPSGGGPGAAWVDVQAERGLSPTLACAPVSPAALGAGVPHGPREVGHTGPGAPDPARDGCLRAALRWLGEQA